MQLIVVAKEPVPGQVKTRLCPPCTYDQAAAIAEQALADTLEAAVDSGADRVALALSGRPGPWCPTGVEIVDQGHGALDRRLAAAWRHAWGRGPALQIGMDTPQVGVEGLDAAMATLVQPSVGAVLGPAADGGWWALGLRDPDPSVVLGIPTSRSDTGARQRARLRQRHLRVVDLWVERDLDTWDDVIAAGYDGVVAVAG